MIGPTGIFKEKIVLYPKNEALVELAAVFGTWEARCPSSIGSKNMSRWAIFFFVDVKYTMNLKQLFIRIMYKPDLLSDHTKI